MIRSIENRINKLDSELKEVIEKMNAEPGRVHLSPDGKWSPAQVMHHLFISEYGTVNYLNKKIQSDAVPSAGLRGFFASLLLKRALKNQSKKYKAPNVLGEMPEKPDFDKLQRDFLNLRKELRTVLGRFNKKMARKAYFKHPIAGRLNIYQTLSFLEDHFYRHKLQIYERLNHGKE